VGAIAPTRGFCNNDFSTKIENFIAASIRLRIACDKEATDPASKLK
jgi:hypothetical protein